MPPDVLSGAVLAIDVAVCGADAAEVVHGLTQAAFAAYGVLVPPSGALAETVESVRADLAAYGGMLATAGGEPAGCLRFSRRDGALFVRRVAVDPGRQRDGIGRALMAAAEEYARDRGEPEVRLGVRAVLDGNRAFYARLGYQEIVDHDFWIELAKQLD